MRQPSSGAFDKAWYWEAEMMIGIPGFRGQNQIALHAPRVCPEPEMANDEDLARLRQGVAVWTDWRALEDRIPSRLRVNLSAANLRGADLSGAILVKADLYKTNPPMLQKTGRVA